MKTVQKNYLEWESSKKWMDKNLPPHRQSKFIRENNKRAIDELKKKK